jgi:hypothetical protein
VTQHHCFAVKGTDPGKFRELGFKKTTEDDKLEYFVHFHSYTIGEPVPCNDQCQVIRSGKLENVVPVTRSEDAPVIPGR